MPETETATAPTFREAFEASVQQHSSGQAAEATSEGPAVESTGETETAQQTQDNSAKVSEPAGADTEALISDEEFSKLKDNPEQLRKSLQAAFTKKTMALAEQRKSLEQYQGLIQAWESNPQEVVKALARQAGIDLAEPRTNAEAKAQAKTITDELRESLGPELEFLADKLAPALERLVKTGVEQITAKEIQPLKEQQQKMAAETAEAQTNALLEAFSAKHPDWKQHEQKMVEIGKKLQPAQGMDDLEYMEMLHALATRDVSEAERLKAAAKRINQSAAKSDSSEAGVSGDKIAVSPTGPLSFRDAFEAAKKGIRIEH